jgi:hypothetical protein
LSAEIWPWKGLDSNTEDKFRTILMNIKWLALKLYQKATLISTYIVPHFLNRLSVAVPTISILRQLDQELWTTIKKIFHLPQSTANGLLYCSKRDGGLRIPKFKLLTVSTSLSIGYKFLRNQDLIIQALAKETSLEKCLQQLARSARIHLLITLPHVITAYKRREKKRELSNWASLNTQGKSIKNLTNDQIGNAWLYNPRLLKPGQFTTALKMRSHTTANRVALHRVRPQPDLNCRKCCAKNETLGHILGLCVYTKHQYVI